MHRFSSIIPLLALIVSCTPQENDELHGRVQTSVNAATPATKLGITSSGAVSWEESDEISVFTDTDAEDGESNYRFLITNIKGATNGTFSGRVANNPQRRKIYLVYPYNKGYTSTPALFKSSFEIGDYGCDFSPSSLHISVPQNQEMGSASKYAMMWGCADVEGSDFTKASVQMKHLTLLLDLTIQNPESKKVTGVSIKASDKVFPIEAVLDMTDGSSVQEPLIWADNICLNFPYVRSSSSIQARFVLLPSPAYSGEKIDIQVRFQDGASEHFSFNGPASELRAGGRYTNTVVLGEGEYRSCVDDGYYYGLPYNNVPSVDKMTVYEASPRLFAANQSLKAIKNQLDRIAKLNVNVLWIMPIFEASKVRKPQGSPYSMLSFERIDSEYGTIDDLRELVTEAHKRNIAVILDFITNHTGADCAWVKEHPSWYMNAYSPTDTEAALFNWENTELQDEIIRIMKYWIQSTNIDGYRCDTAMPGRENGVPLSFWRRASAELKAMQNGRNVIMLAEAANQSCLNYGFDVNYGWHYYEALESLFAGTQTVSNLFTINSSEWSDAAILNGKTRMRYSTNHDKNSKAALCETYGSQEGADAAFVLALTMGGAPMIYSSQEVGYNQRVSFFKGGTSPIDWNMNPGIFERYCNLMKLSLNNTLRKGTINRISNTNVVSFTREYSGKTILVLVNVRNSNSSFSISSTYKNANYTNLLSGEPYSFTTTELPPYGYLVLEKN